MSEIYGNSDGECYAYRDAQGTPGPLTVADTNAHVSLPWDMRTMRAIGVQLVTTGTLDGAWKVEVSNDFVPDTFSSYGASPRAGTWTDVTSAFSPTIAAVNHASAATQNQYVYATIRCRRMRATFTGSGGSGTIVAIINGGP